MGRLKGTLPLNISSGSAVIEKGSIITADLADGCVTTDKMRDKKCLFPVIAHFQGSLDGMIGDDNWGMVAPFNMELIEVSLHLKDPGSVGQTEVDIKYNGSSIFPSGPLALPFSEGNFKTMDLQDNPIGFADNSHINIDIESVATDASDLTVAMTFKVNLLS